MNRSETFSIRQMVELTGLSEFTIRGWENRYAAFQPRRGDTGRREYSKVDVERALLLRELLKRGHKIGKVAQHNRTLLQKLFSQHEPISPQAPSSANPKTRKNSALIAQAMELVALQKWTELEILIKSVPSRNPIELIHSFFLPAISALVSSVENKIVSISQEHIFSAFLKEKIYSCLEKIEMRNMGRATPGEKSQMSRSTRRFVLATPEGDHHDIGLLLAHLMIRAHGHKSLYLGPHTPSLDLSETALRFDASHVLIVATVSKKSGARQELLSYMNDVQKKLGAHLKIFVAGSQAPALIQSDSSQLHYLTSFQALEAELKKLGEKI